MSATSTPAERDGAEANARDRIRDAAIAEFGARGPAATSLKVVARTAGVSPALIVHHFGSKQALRTACDEHVAARIRAAKFEAVADGPHLDAVAVLRRAGDRVDELRYLARTLGDGTPHVAALIDDLVDDAVDDLAEGVRSGLMKPSERPRERATVLVLWSLGLLTLHEHVARLLDVDLVGDSGGLENDFLPAVEILANGVLADGVYEQLRDAFDDGKGRG